MLEYTADGLLTINQQSVPRQQLEARLRTIFDRRGAKTLFIAGPSSERPAEIIELLEAAKAAGVTKVGLVTDGNVSPDEVQRRVTAAFREAAPPLRRD